MSKVNGDGEENKLGSSSRKLSIVSMNESIVDGADLDWLCNVL